MKIGELAKAANCLVETVRYYEREGLMTKPERTSNNNRVYQQAHLQRLCFIRNCRSLDMTHREIKGLIAMSFAFKPSRAHTHDQWYPFQPAACCGVCHGHVPACG